MKEQEIYQTALKKFGINAQIGQLHEEIGELMVAISKAKRAYESKVPYYFLLEYRKDVLSEIADVEIMLEQIKIVFNDIEHLDFESIKKTKLQKLENYLKE